MRTDEERYIRNRLWIIFGAIQLAFLALIIGIFINIQKGDRLSEDYKSQPKIKIKDMSKELKDLPENERGIIAQELTRALSLNTNEINLNNTVAEIREGYTKKSYTHQNLTFYNMIIDIPELEQSYRIYHEYSKDETNKFFTYDKTTIATCVYDQKFQKYKFECNSRYEKSEDERILRKYLTFESFGTFSASLGADNSILITPIAQNFSAEEKENSIKAAKEAIKGLGFNPESYTYSVIDAASLTYEL